MANETTNTATVEIWVLVDEEGDYVALDCPDALHERYDEVHSTEQRDLRCTRRVKITLTIPLPRPVELVGTVAAEPEGGELVAK